MRGGGSRTAAALWGAASRTYSILLAAFLCSCRQELFFTKQRSYRYCCMDALHGRLLNVWKKSLTTTTTTFDSNEQFYLIHRLDSNWQ